MLPRNESDRFYQKFHITSVVILRNLPAIAIGDKKRNHTEKSGTVSSFQIKPERKSARVSDLIALGRVTG